MLDDMVPTGNTETPAGTLLTGTLCVTPPPPLLRSFFAFLFSHNSSQREEESVSAFLETLSESVGKLLLP